MRLLGSIVAPGKDIPARLGAAAGLLGVLALLTGAALAQGAGNRHYLYLSDQRLVTIELISPQKAILNYINLAETIEVVEASRLVVLDAARNAYRGHLFEVEDPAEGDVPFELTRLIRPREHLGVNVLGNYRFEAAPRQAYFKVGSKILELEALSEANFDVVASRVGDLNFEETSSTLMIRLAGFDRGYGTVHAAGGVETEPLERLFPSQDVLAPVLLEDPRPRLPSAFSHLPDPVAVGVEAVVGRSGGLFDVRASERLDPRLDQLAVDAVRNSWRFLPAISEGRIVAAEVTLRVVFRRR